MPIPTTAVISEMAGWNRSLVGKHRYRNKFDLNALPDYGVEEWRDGVGNGVAGNTVNDGNQTPVRNPPGAFHNSANTLAQHNLLGGIILWIKMQSFGICKHLSTWYQQQWHCHKETQQNKNEKQKRKHENLQQLQEQHPEQRKQRAQKQNINWQPLNYQPKNHFTSLQRASTAYEQSSAFKPAAVAYTQRLFRLPTQWMIRRIGALKAAAATENEGTNAKFELANHNELRNKGKTDAEPTLRHLVLILRLLLLTAPFLRTLTTRASTLSATSALTTTTKSSQMPTEVRNVKKTTTNDVENLAVSMNTLAGLAAVDGSNGAAVTVAVAVKNFADAQWEIVKANTYSSIKANTNKGNILSEVLLDTSRQTQCNSNATESDRSSADMEFNNRNGKQRNISDSFVKPCCVNRNTEPNKVKNNSRCNLQLSYTFNSKTVKFLLFPLLLVFMEVKVSFEIYLLLILLTVHITKPYLQFSTQFPMSVLQLTTNCGNKKPRSSNGTSKSTITDRTKRFPISRQRLGNTIKIISATNVFPLFCCQKWVVWEHTTTTLAAAAFTSFQPQSITTSSGERATIHRSLTDEAAEVDKTIKTQGSATAAAMRTLTVTAIATAMATFATASIVTSLARCCGSALR
ncbi:uncharacterized protein LOC118735323 [Rhagoletis pomonella]|uniref:uncharacterized protein LOC118735323 n=1 Tax=Rhagoletis pomonella TaxID=28610 RepID=UPI00178331C2|nr:uncharacterized protein LOC118735323 [Rhagoletis pomonella]